MAVKSTMTRQRCVVWLILLGLNVHIWWRNIILHQRVFQQQQQQESTGTSPLLLLKKKTSLSLVYLQEMAKNVTNDPRHFQQMAKNATTISLQHLYRYYRHANVSSFKKFPSSKETLRMLNTFKHQLLSLPQRIQQLHNHKKQEELPATETTTTDAPAPDAPAPDVPAPAPAPDVALNSQTTEIINANITVLIFKENANRKLPKWARNTTIVGAGSKKYKYNVQFIKLVAAAKDASKEAMSMMYTITKYMMNHHDANHHDEHNPNDLIIFLNSQYCQVLEIQYLFQNEKTFQIISEKGWISLTCPRARKETTTPTPKINVQSESSCQTWWNDFLQYYHAQNNHGREQFCIATTWQLLHQVPSSTWELVSNCLQEFQQHGGEEWERLILQFIVTRANKSDPPTPLLSDDHPNLCLDAPSGYVWKYHPQDKPLRTLVYPPNAKELANRQNQLFYKSQQQIPKNRNRNAIRIVVAHYKEYLDANNNNQLQLPNWAKDVNSNYRVEPIYQRFNEKNHFNYVPNHGHEAGAYLRFIVDHYRQLPSVTVFLRANACHVNEIDYLLQNQLSVNMVETVGGFLPINCNPALGRMPNLWGQENTKNMTLCWRNLLNQFVGMKTTNDDQLKVNIMSGSCMAVSRNLIKRIPHKVWKAMYEQTIVEGKCLPKLSKEGEGGQATGRAMEHLSHVIFGNKELEWNAPICLDDKSGLVLEYRQGSSYHMTQYAIGSF